MGRWAGRYFEAVRDFRIQFVRTELEKYDFDVARTSLALGVTVAGLYKMIHDLGIDIPTPRMGRRPRR